MKQQPRAMDLISTLIMLRYNLPVYPLWDVMLHRMGIKDKALGHLFKLN